MLPSNLHVQVYDEAGFEPTSSSGLYPAVDIGIFVYDLESNLVANGISDSEGIASFSLPEGIYTETKIIHEARAILAYIE